MKIGSLLSRVITMVLRQFGWRKKVEDLVLIQLIAIRYRMAQSISEAMLDGFKNTFGGLKMDISPEIISWCKKNGYTDPQIVDGKVWAFNSMDLMPVPTEYKSDRQFPNDTIGRMIERELYLYRQQRSEQIINSLQLPPRPPRPPNWQFQLTTEIQAERIACLRLLHSKPVSFSIETQLNPIRFSIESIRFNFKEYSTTIKLDFHVLPINSMLSELQNLLRNDSSSSRILIAINTENPTVTHPFSCWVMEFRMEQASSRCSLSLRL
jgi:hypothetical protein